MMCRPCSASPGANADAVVSYCSPGLAGRPKAKSAVPWKLSGTLIPTGQLLPPPPVTHRPFSVITLMPEKLPVPPKYTVVPTSDGEAATRLRVILRPWALNSALYFFLSAYGFLTITSMKWPCLVKARAALAPGGPMLIGPTC